VYKQALVGLVFKEDKFTRFVLWTGVCCALVFLGTLDSWAINVSDSIPTVLVL